VYVKVTLDDEVVLPLTIEKLEDVLCIGPKSTVAPWNSPTEKSLKSVVFTTYAMRKRSPSTTSDGD
jgi:hypothetical protein